MRSLQYPCLDAVRVFADESGHIYACPACVAKVDIAETARVRAYEVRNSTRVCYNGTGSRMNGDEIDRRIDQDDGSGTDTVWVARSVAATVYHADRTCSSFRRETDRRALARSMAQRKRFAPCARCVLDGTPDAAPDPSEYDRGATDPEKRYADLFDRLRTQEDG